MAYGRVLAPPPSLNEVVANMVPIWGEHCKGEEPTLPFSVGWHFYAKLMAKIYEDIRHVGESVLCAEVTSDRPN